MNKLLLFITLCAVPSFAQIAHDASSTSTCGSGGGCNTASTFSHTHTPVGTPRGVAVSVHHLGDSTDDISACTYGGVAMAKICFAQDTTTAPGSATMFFLGASIPTGAQTVECTDDDTTTSTKQLAATTVTAGANTETAGSDTCEVNGDVDDPSCTVTGIPGASYAFGGFYSGQGVPANITAGTGFTIRSQVDFGADSAHWETSTSEQASGDQVIAFTTATALDVALCGMAIQQVVSAGSARRRIIIQ